MKYLQNFVSENEDTLTFDVNNLSHSLVNAIRRLIISDVETIAFRTEYGKQSDIVIHKNTSSLHNEFLANRISLVPIHVPSSQIAAFNPDKYEFFIQEQNNSSSPMDITTEHIQVRDVSKSPPTLLSKAACRELFPPSKITGDYILLNRLKPNRTSNLEGGETLDITMKASRSCGKDHARYCPTCVSIFTNRQDPEKVQTELEKRLEQKEAIVKSQENRNLTAEERQDLRESFMLGEADRHFMTNSEGEPNAFHFTVESDGRIGPHNIFMSALHILDRKIDEFMDKIVKEQEFEIQKGDSIMFAYDFIFENEDYTLSYLFQNYLYQFYQNVEDPKIKYVGCTVPHPLENKMVIRIALRDSSLQSDYIKSLFQETSKEIKKIIKDLKADMLAQKIFVLDK